MNFIKHTPIGALIIALGGLVLVSCGGDGGGGGDTSTPTPPNLQITPILPASLQTGNARRLTTDGRALGVLAEDNSEQQDVYIFALDEGDEFRATITEQTGGTVSLRVYNQALQQVTTEVSADGTLLTFTAPQTGNYYLAVGRVGGATVTGLGSRDVSNNVVGSIIYTVKVVKRAADALRMCADDEICRIAVKVVVPEVAIPLLSDIAAQNMRVSVTGSETPQSNQLTVSLDARLDLMIMVRNLGPALSRPTTMQFFRSTDSTLTVFTAVGQETAEGNSMTVPALTSQQSREYSATITAPTTAGDYYYGACATPNITETDGIIPASLGDTEALLAALQMQTYQNNCAISAVRVTVAPAPDLVVSATVNDDALSLNESFTLRATVHNQGSGEAAATTLTYYRSSDAIISTSDTSIGTNRIAVLAANTDSDESIDLTAPSAAGTYYYGACVAPVAGETDTSNNCSKGVEVVVGGEPELTVIRTTVTPTTIAAGERATLTLRATVRNQGSGEAAATTVTYYRSSDAIISTSDTSIGTNGIAVLAANTDSDESIDLTAPAEGSYYYGACVAPVAGETDTSNNCSKGVKVVVGGGPELTVIRMTVTPTTSAVGERLTLRATVRNQGSGEAAATTLNYYRYDFYGSPTSDTLIGTTGIAVLAANTDSEEISIDLLAPPAAGVYYYSACVSPVAGETDTSNNCTAERNVQVDVVGADLAVGYWDIRDTSSLIKGALELSPNESFTLRATVRNQGSVDAAATTLNYYLDDYFQYVQSSSVGEFWEELLFHRIPQSTLISTTDIGVLAANTDREESIDLTAPSAVGTYYYGACVSHDDVEIEFLNDCGLLLPLINVTIPDLFLSRMTATPTTITPGERTTLTLGATVFNHGSRNITVPTVTYYRSSDAIINTQDTSIGTNNIITFLEAYNGFNLDRAARIFLLNLKVELGAGTYYYGACVAPVAGETDTTDNCSEGVEVVVRW